MNALRIQPATTLAIAVAVAIGVAGCQGMYGTGGERAAAAPARAAATGGQSVSLTGSNEVPPVTTSASGNGTIRVAGDGSVSGSIKVTGVNATAAHIHQGAAGANGPVIVPLTKDGDTFNVPAGAKLTPDQMAAYKAGNLYVNVHSAAHPGGEIRAQLRGGG